MPDEYISREKTLALLKSLGSRDYRREKGTIQDAIKMISSAAYTPAADVAPVVRCKDCKSWRRNVGIVDSPNGHCFERDDETNGWDYCSDGEAI